jgi:23S rRNA (adenine2503-C2)-methyltransferase
MSLLDLDPTELTALLSRSGHPPYRGRQLAHALYVRGVETIDEISVLPRALREALARDPGLPKLRVVEGQEAQDGSTKYLFELEDGARIESVAMPRENGRTTFCISSQVGCRLGCVFCATGRMGLVRQLAAGEIVGQVRELRRRHPSRVHPNLVFMGMGEPLDNLEHVLRALEIMMHPQGMRLGARRITVSTAGLIDGIQRLSEWGRPVGLALSVTTANPAERRELMPVAGKVPLHDLLAAAAEFGRRTRRRVTLECAVIAGVNDSPHHARALLQLAQRGPFKVNLIPLNPIDRFPGERPAEPQLSLMADIIWQGGVVATVRDSQGRDVEAACGQLVHRQRRRMDRAPKRPVLRQDSFDQ